MTLRRKLLLAQLPLLVALSVTGMVASTTTEILGESGRRILYENYRSVLAAQRMKEAVESLDNDSLLMVMGRQAVAHGTLAAQRQAFRDELAVELANVTEEGEAQAAKTLATLFDAYDAKLERLLVLPAPQRDAYYFDSLQPSVRALNKAANVILTMNQDAMARKSDGAGRTADRARTWVITVALLGAFLGLAASGFLTMRLLAPLSVLTLTARRIGEGDLAVRAKINNRDEVGALARELNLMADRLDAFTKSSLGELIEAQHRTLAAVDSLPDPVAIIRRDGVVAQSNDAARALGLETDASFHQVRPELRALLTRLCEPDSAPFAPRTLEDAIRVKDENGERAYLPRATAVRSEGGAVVGTSIVLQDVTRLMLVDELRNNLVATVAHEFRTPLTSLRMAIHLCIEGAAGPLTETQQDLLYTARQDCERLQSVIDELLDLSRIQSGKVELRKEEIDVRRCMNDVVAQHRDVAEAGGVALHVSVHPEAERVIADPERLQIVLANLLGNAIRHSPRGGVIELGARPAAQGGVRFEVVDQGAGIPLAYQERIFERSFQVPGKTRGAAGLGLAIARDVVEAHGGVIGVSSREGEGSTFWFELPGAVAES